MRSVDESFQRMVSKRYGVNLTESVGSKSIFDQLDECDKVKPTKKKLTESLNEARPKEWDPTNYNGYYKRPMHSGFEAKPKVRILQALADSSDNNQLDRTALAEKVMGKQINSPFTLVSDLSDLQHAGFIKIDGKIVRLTPEGRDYLGNLEANRYGGPENSANDFDTYSYYESLNEATQRNFSFRSGREAQEFFNKLFVRGYEGQGNNAETKKAIPAYNEVCKLLGANTGSDDEKLAKLYDKADPKTQLAVTKLTRLATTWGGYSDEVAASYDEALKEGKGKDLLNRGFTAVGFGKTYEVGNKQFKNLSDAEKYAEEHGGKLYEISNKEARAIHKGQNDLEARTKFNPFDSLEKNQGKADMLAAASKVKAERKLIKDYGPEKDGIKGLNDSLIEATNLAGDMDINSFYVDQIQKDLDDMCISLNIPVGTLKSKMTKSELDNISKKYGKLPQAAINRIRIINEALIEADNMDRELFIHIKGNVGNSKLMAARKALEDAGVEFEILNKDQVCNDKASGVYTTEALKESYADSDFDIPGLTAEIIATPEENIAAASGDTDQDYYLVKYTYNGKFVLMLAITPDNNAWYPCVEYEPESGVSADKYWKRTDYWQSHDVPADERWSKPFDYVSTRVQTVLKDWIRPGWNKSTAMTEALKRKSLREAKANKAKALSKEALCNKWGCSAEEFDAMTDAGIHEPIKDVFD